MGGGGEASSEHQDMAGCCCGALVDATPHSAATVQCFRSTAIGEECRNAGKGITKSVIG